MTLPFKTKILISVLSLDFFLIVILMVNLSSRTFHDYYPIFLNYYLMTF